MMLTSKVGFAGGLGSMGEIIAWAHINKGSIILPFLTLASDPDGKSCSMGLSDYSRNSVTSLLSSLSILTLQQRHQLSRLTLFYKIINNTLPISIPSHYQRTQFCTGNITPIISFYHKQPSTPINIVFILELLKTGMSCQLI